MRDSIPKQALRATLLSPLSPLALSSLQDRSRGRSVKSGTMYLGVSVKGHSPCNVIGHSCKVAGALRQTCSRAGRPWCVIVKMWRPDQCVYDLITRSWFVVSLATNSKPRHDYQGVSFVRDFCEVGAGLCSSSASMWPPVLENQACATCGQMVFFPEFCNSL